MINLLSNLYFKPSAGREFGGLFLGALFICLSFPPFNLSFLAWFSLLPLFFLFERESGFWPAWIRSYLFLLIAHTTTLYWICFSTVAGGVLAILVNPVFMMIPVTLFLLLRQFLTGWHQLALLGGLWIFGEYFLSLWELAFPWMLLSNTQFLFSPVLQWASIGGAWLVSGWVFLFNLLVYPIIKSVLSGKQVTHQDVQFPVFAVCGIILAGYLIGEADIPQTGRIQAAVVQPNVDPWIKWDQDLENYEQLMALSRKVIEQDSTVRLIVWPETAVGFYLLDPRGEFIRKEMEDYTASHHTAILTGFPHISYYEDSLTAPPSARWSRMSQKYYHHYNAATLIDGYEPAHAYSKISLVPFAERVPWVDSVPFMKDLRFNLSGLGGWGKGRDTTNFKLAGTEGAVFPSAICYESAFPELIGRFTSKGATFLTVITNDGWWGNTSGYHQHFEFSRLRAIENRRWVVRSANNGISGFIDEKGNVISSTGYWTEQTLTATVGLISEQSVYQKTGNWFPWLALFLSAGLLATGLFRRIKQ